MNRSIALCSLALLTLPSALTAQLSSSSNQMQIFSNSDGGSAATATNPTTSKQPVVLKPFSRFALSGGISLMGVNLQAATNLNQHLNLRATGNVFRYSVNNISTNGFNLTGNLNMATAGASLDYYPFTYHGFRLTPGVLFYNQNQASVNIVATGGTSFKLNEIEYYSSASNPVQGTASVGFHAQNPAFTITTGWGNMIPRKGGHWSFPFELGAAVTGSPTVNVALTQGQVCDQSGLNCINVASDANLNTDLQAEIAKYKKDLDPLKVYPIFSFGISYNFRIR